MSARRQASAVLASVGLFVLLVAVAVARYPGGTWNDPAAPGHDFSRNFLCDLGAPVAPSGAPNPVGAWALPAAMLALVLGVGFFWSLLARRLDALPRPAAAVRRLGALSLLGMIAVPLAPSSRVGALHAVAILAAALPALAAATLGWLALARVGARRLAALGAAAVLVSAVDGALYAGHLALGGPVPLALPALQRLATLLVVGWMVAVAADALARSPEAD